ncbi:type VI secretion system tip protein VgrG [Deltaproteobacteria bacterium Smac51]|nr:type VI secretion system tip protein VgrG [Deltaproteobacteria bacterium Smac51]
MAKWNADEPWFNISIEGGPQFGVYSLKGQEEINITYDFEVELVSRESSMDLASLIGLPSLLSMADHGGEVRQVHGLIRQAQQLHTGIRFTHYRVWLAPRLWFLGRNSNHRIFQNLSVVEIIDEILKEHKFIPREVNWKLKESYQQREYCVQYGESDLYFISRLCEEEGIYFYFEHSEDCHTLCFSDASGGPWISGRPEGLVRFHPGSGQSADGAVIRKMAVEHRINSDKATFKEWNFEQPSLELECAANEPDRRKAPAPGGLKLEWYNYPYLYDLNSPGQRYAKSQLGRQLTFSVLAEGSSDLCALTPGFSFKLHGHPRREANESWWLTAIRHYGEQPQILEDESPDGRGFVYNNTFKAIPFTTRFFPETSHPKKTIDGLHSAIVTGPDGEEIFVDKYGRIKAHFHWDRLGENDERSSCWIRVATGWAGKNFGQCQAPRIGQEVLVEFMEGDPDRPVVTGRAYKADLMPPWTLPSQVALSGLQSRELYGDRRNQIVMDDTPGQVQVQISSDHDLSQLSLGRLLRIFPVAGRMEPRGEGFELRTDGWGVVRAAEGMFITTYEEPESSKHHKSMAETVERIMSAADQHKRQSQSAADHEAQSDEPGEVAPALESQNQDIKGSGQDSGELAQPHILFSSPAGLADFSPECIHTSARENLALTAFKNISFVSGTSFVVSALRRLSLFAQSSGMKIFAGQGKVEIQAQSGDMDIIAEKVISLISKDKMIHISSPQEISLVAGDSYLKIGQAGVESGTSGKFVAHASSHSFTGADSETCLSPDLPSGD